METIYQFNSDDHFLRQLDRMNKELKELAVIMDENNRVQRYGRPPQYVVHQHQVRRTPPKRTSALVFPFSLLAACIDGALTRCDQAVGWFVKEVIGRWVQRFLSWKRNRRRN